MPQNRKRLLEQRVGDHKAAVREFVDKASALDSGQWLTPKAEGKWTPAQEARHLILTYDAIIRDLEGSTILRLHGSPWKRRIWRWIGLSSILWRKRIPVAVTAPRVARPEWETIAASELLPQLRRRADDFDDVLARLWHTEPDRRVTHPMMGMLSLDHTVRLMSVHTRHHAAFLPAALIGARQ